MPAEVSFAHFRAADDRLVACASTRHGGTSRAPWDSCNLSFGVGDDPEAVLENRRRACAALGFGLDDLTVADQVHGAAVVVVDGTQRGCGARPGAAVAAADALVTATPGVLLGVLLADCVPVLLVDPGKGVVAAAHAGWRGTVAHVAAGTVATMVDTFGCRPEDLLAGIGPSIGPESYEVGPDVIDAATRAYPDTPEVLRRDARGRTTFDLWAANAADLRACGVAEHHLEVLGIDTFATTDRWFSHRAGAPTGRFVAFAAVRR